MIFNSDGVNRLQKKLLLLILGLWMGVFFNTSVLAFSVSLTAQGSNTDGTTNPVNAFRWLVEEDNTHPVTPGVSDPASLSLSFHKSHAPVVKAGDQSNADAIELTDGKRYFISVLPSAGYTIGGGPIADQQGSVTVICNQLPLPTAQISVFVFHDNFPLNNVPDAPEEGLAGFKITVEDAGGRYGVSAGQQMMDAFGNMIGTTYQTTNGVVDLDPEGNPIVQTPGQGFVVTDAQGNALIKYMAPAKYGIQAVPPAGQGWQQTSTIEGTSVIDAWVKPNEPPFFTEFGPAGQHVAIGFIQPTNIIPQAAETSTITGQVVNMRMARPPLIEFSPGEPHANVWVGLNAGATGTGQALYAAPADTSTGEFTIPWVPPGGYQLVFWDRYLNNVFAFQGIVVPPGGGAIDLGQIPVFRWFGKMENKVYYDADENGLRDPGESFVFPEQAINIRFRDGSLFQTLPTDNSGEAPLEEVFPFFNWLVAEVDFARFKATGMTVTVDGGGPADPGSDIHAQAQDPNDPFNELGNSTSRTESGPVLTQGMQLFLGQTNKFEWGKKEYAAGENGGISGIVYYDSTRAENDPRYGLGEPWQPGIPRVQVNLYADGGAVTDPLGALPDGIIDDLDGDGAVTLADVDNYPFQWAPMHQGLPGWTGVRGTEDVDRDDDGTFDYGDAIQIATTDSWDDNQPTGCPGDPMDPFYDINSDGVGDCYDGLRNFNQVRPGVFDGGYAFASYFPGGMSAPGSTEVESLPAASYIVEVTTPSGYELVKEEDKNVDFGDGYTPSLLLLPTICVGDDHTVPAELDLFPGVPAAFAGQVRPLCDRKQVPLNQGANAAADFFLFTKVPKAARIVGFVLNDLANEFNPLTPNFGEKYAPPWLPISIRDYRGALISRVYTDENGAYNALVPSTFTANRPTPSGFAPNMLTVVINDSTDARYNPLYTSFQYTLQYMPGVTTYLDTPVLPIAAFAAPNTRPVDAEFPDGTPVIRQVDTTSGLGPYAASGTNTITIRSAGTDVAVPNPNYDGTNNLTITRDYGFGNGDTGSSVTILDDNGSVIATFLGNDADVTWGPNTITLPNVSASGQLVVTRDDGAGNPGKSSIVGIYLTIGGPGNVIYVSPGADPNDRVIQTAIDGASDGDLILVTPGTYYELVILHKNVRLQGSGAGVPGDSASGTRINAIKVPAEKLLTWENDIATRLALQFDLLPGQAAANPFNAELGPAIIVLGESDGSFNSARIDGFTINSADQGGGILVNGYTNNLMISNNRVSGNQGFYGGGIRIGHPELIVEDPPGAGTEVYVDAQNDDLTIRYNHITQNGGLNGAGGGISIHTGASNYNVNYNFIVGNFTSGEGAGIGHLGLSSGVITTNTIVFNQSFNQGVTVTGGGVLIAGQPPLNGEVAGPGSGAVTIDHNRIQGNQAGSGDGGGIAVRATYAGAVNINNNLIINNVTGLAGGGIALQDAANVTINDNTIARNDSTATASLAFENGPALPSINQPAGVVSRANTSGVAGFSDPVSFSGNIIWQNSTYYWDPLLVSLVPSVGPDNAGPPREFWDLGVLGAPDTADQLNPLNGTLTSLTGYDGVVYDGSNSIVDPVLAGAYFNGSRGIPSVNEFTTGIQTAIAADEGGNAIDVAFGPLSLTGSYADTGQGGPAGTIGVLRVENSAGLGTAAPSTASGSGSTCFIDTTGGQAYEGLQATLLFGLGVLLASLLFCFGTRIVGRYLRGRMRTLGLLLLVVGVMTLLPTARSMAQVQVQCPGDINGDGIPDEFLLDQNGDPTDVPNPAYDPDVICMHLAAGDGFINMADGTLQYIFGFNNVTGTTEADVIMASMLGATFPAPVIVLPQGKKFYLTLTNVGMMMRPDLFDPHTVHYHGFPNASAVFDGVPDSSISINMGASLTYFYNLVEPGTFMYHCHVEATEHMQMGMLGQLYVTPVQDGTEYQDPDGSGRVYTKFAYNDGDGSTGYDVTYPIQIASFDPVFHNASITVQPLPFALMDDLYPMLNGRGYPDTVNPDPLTNTAADEGYGEMNRASQKMSALIEATAGQKILLRVSSLSTTSFHSLTVLGIPMTVVGQGARILRGPDGKDLFYKTTSVDLGGGEAKDIILDTLGVPVGTYFLYVTNLDHLSNDAEDYGGMMTEIRISAAPVP
jgi:hypothetical protein